MTASTNMHWGETSWQSIPFDQETDFENNRIQKPGWEFDADGRNTKAISDSSEITLTTFDAAGRVIERNSGGSVSWTYYDGNGSPLTSKSTEEQKYQIRSSVLGGKVVTQVWGNGKKYRSYVRGIGNQTAVQTAYAASNATLSESVLFEYSDTFGMSYRTTDKNAAAVAVGDGGEGSPIETDPLGGSVGTSTPYIEEPIIYQPEPEYPELRPFEIAGGQEMMESNFASLYATFGSRIADLPGFGTNWGSFAQLDMMLYDERVENARLGFGFVTNEEYAEQAAAQAAAQTAAGESEGGHEGGHAGSGTDGEGSSEDGASGDGSWVDTSTSTADYNTNIVTINISGYWNFANEFGQTAISGSQFIRFSRSEANRMMNDAYNRAIHLMEGNKNCRDAVSSTKMDAVTEAKRLSAEGKFVPRENEVNGTEVARSLQADGPSRSANPLGGTVVVPSRGGKVEMWNSFFADGGAYVPVGNVYAFQLLNADDRRALTILHELAHVTRRNGHGASFIQALGVDDTIESSSLNAIIWDACFGPQK
ncbi:MAG TPA: hypothetical protein PLK77_18670 [Pyrinomonadaceae bacterium]|nr:hypothetical protein [Pyrinomonadaceae bacterium]